MKKITSKIFKSIILMSLIAISSIVMAIEPEKRSMQEIYQAALKEWGVVTVYAGGDVQSQAAGIKEGFEKAFPGMKLNVIVDYSKVHDGRLDFQVATKKIIPDVVQFQTLHDFPRWKQEGILMNYKPISWDKVYKDFKDPDGAWTAGLIITFHSVSNKDKLGNIKTPKEAKDFLDPKLKGKLISAYPNDDDAVLFWYKQNIDKYGWKWMEDLMKQNPKFVRGSHVPKNEVKDKNTQYTTTLGTSRDASSQSSTFDLPEKDGFMAWAQRVAILKSTKHLESAKLYLNWLIENQGSPWGVRTDKMPPKGYKQIWEYKNSNMKEFEKFMMDRAGVESFKAQIRLFVGDVKGEPTPGELGLYPDKPLSK